MKLAYLQKPKKGWCFKITASKQYPRHWIVAENLEITLSDNSVIVVPKGFIWDGGSIPKKLWWLFHRIDKNSIAFLIHDFLYIDKLKQIEKFNVHIYNARKFADDEMMRWLCEHHPKSKFSNNIFYFVIRKIGGFFYSRQFKIPN